MLASDTLIAERRAALEQRPEVRLALLFGSRARGSASAESGVDIAVDAPGADLLALGAGISERVGSEVDVVSLNERARFSNRIVRSLIWQGGAPRPQGVGRGRRAPGKTRSIQIEQTHGHGGDSPSRT